jgi:cobyric acid synthase
LERIRALLVARGVKAESARLAIFGRSGFDRDLRQLARRRSDVVLVDLRRLYTGT